MAIAEIFLSRAADDAIASAMVAFCTAPGRSYNTVLKRLLATNGSDRDPEGKAITRARLYNSATGATAMPEWLPALFDRAYGPVWRNPAQAATDTTIDSEENSRRNSTSIGDNETDSAAGLGFAEATMFSPQDALKSKREPLPAWQSAPVPNILVGVTQMQSINTDEYRPWCKPGDANFLRPNVVPHINRLYAVTETATGLSFYAAMVEVDELTVYMDYEGDTYLRSEIQVDAAVVWTVPDYVPMKVAGLINTDGLEVGKQIVWPRPKKTL